MDLELHIQVRLKQLVPVRWIDRDVAAADEVPVERHRPPRPHGAEDRQRVERREGDADPDVAAAVRDVLARLGAAR